MKAEFKIATNCNVTNITAELQAENVVVFAALQPILFEMLDSMKTIIKGMEQLQIDYEVNSSRRGMTTS